MEDMEAAESSLFLLAHIALLAICILLIYWYTAPYRCPICGERMNYIKKHIKECPKCGYREYERRKEQSSNL
jgi:NADH pyrophosphatase NudC (nudix superfamily)